MADNAALVQDGYDGFAKGDGISAGVRGRPSNDEQIL